MEVQAAPALRDKKKKKDTESTLTVTDVIKGPLVVPKEGVTFNLVHSRAAQTNLPAHSDRSKQSESPKCEHTTQYSTPPFLLSTRHH